MNKECHPSETVRRRGAKSGVTPKVVQLEQKLDGLVSLLAAVTQVGGNVLEPSAAKTLNSGDSTMSEDYPTPLSDPAETPSNSITRDYLPNPAQPSSSASQAGPSESATKYGCWGSSITPASLGFGVGSADSLLSGLYSAFQPSPMEAEEYFMTFRTKMLKRFPLVYIPSSISAQKFSQENPLLFLVIVAICSRSTSYKLALGKEIKQWLSQYLCVETKANLDQLRGLLAFLAW